MRPIAALLRGVSALTLTGFLAACGTAPRAPQPGLAGQDPEVVDPSARLSLEQAQDVTVYALGLVGTPYRYGGNTPDSGFDCSGLIGHVYRREGGLATPRTVAGLQSWGQSVPQQLRRSGDLVLFSQGGAPTHAGIYVGQGRFVHAPSSGGQVRLDSLASPYWSRQQIAFRRP